MHWIYLALAICGNVVANVAFKSLMLSLTQNRETIRFSHVVNSQWFWIAGLGCVILLGGYLIALRSLGLATTYALVTAISLLVTSIAASLIFGEKFPLTKLVGVVTIVAGVLLIFRAEI